MAWVPSTMVHEPYSGYAFARTSSYDFPNQYVGANLLLDNCIIQRNGFYPVAALILADGSKIDTLEFNGFAVQDTPQNSHTVAAQLLKIVSGTIGQLVIDALDSTNIAAPISEHGFSSVGSVSGAGVLATNWPFPDASMANGTPYISANSGLPSIKVGGVVTPYQ